MKEIKIQPKSIGCILWWPHKDLNLGPTDSYHYSFHYQLLYLHCLWSGLYLNHIEILQDVYMRHMQLRPGFHWYKHNSNLGSSCIVSTHMRCGDVPKTRLY